MANVALTDHKADAALRSRTPDDMARIPGGTFRMGSDMHYPEERPAHSVTIDGFWMDRHAVTNADFATFIAATAYVTFAERPLDPALYPGARPELLRPGSAVFRMPSRPGCGRATCATGGNTSQARTGGIPTGRPARSPGGSASPSSHIAFEDA